MIKTVLRPVNPPLTRGYSQPRPQYQLQGYMPNGIPGGGPAAQPLQPNNGRIIQNGPVRVLCIADVRGDLRSLNELAKTANANYILHTGDFGFYDDSSLERIAEKTLKHVAQYSPLISNSIKQQIANVPVGRPVKPSSSPTDLPLSQLPDLLANKFRLDVPVYTVWGACEDVRVLEKFRSGEYKIENLHIIDEVNSRLLDIGGVKLRLLGLGGAVVIHKLFDNGEGKTYIAGGQGTMWTTLLQIGALIDTASRVYDPSETRIFLTHASPARDGILNQLSVTLKADFSISAGLHFRYGSSYNEFSVNPSLDHYRGKLAASKASFNDVWETVKMDVEQAISTNESHKSLLNSALEIVEKMPSVANGGNPFGGPVGGVAGAGQVDESAFKNMWNFNLADAAFGYLVLEVDGGRIGTEMRAQGFNFAHRGAKPMAAQPIPQQTSNAPAAATGTSASVPTGPAQTRTPAFQPPSQPFPQQNPPAPQSRAQAPPARPASTTQQSQAPAKAPTSNSPAPPSTQNKPLTPQPSSSNVPTTSSLAPKPGTPSGTNGTVSAKLSDGEAGRPKPATPPVDRAPTTSLYVMFADSEQQARDCIAEQDRPKIKTVAKLGNKYNNFTISFETHEIAEEALKRASEQSRSVKNAQGKNPRIEWFRERSGPFHQRDSSGSNVPSRGGSASAGPATRGGYTSGGASDSEGGRGRGGFSRGRGRGDRGRGRGMAAGRGSFQAKGDDSKPANAKPQPVKDSS
ncbi:hypothetical protein LTR05_006386 [Lithohypha guttulata]|uniref:DUF2433 domain-containing protein n=1 Tax=Lithohypha guttulata TaxID=1690604 RepID=A0AAN7SXT2_9EURO|nr:hypothetical protein LTR05_006386 [Lithohypha guttulata]